jgi:DNA-directed RNA polymerase specialized sigma subunit
MNSYSVRCICRTPTENINKKKYVYEERITLWQAKDIDEAIEKAEAEVEKYCSDLGDSEFIGLSQAFWMFESIAANGIEVYSLLRESDLESDEYLDTFFSTGDERQR